MYKSVKTNIAIGLISIPLATIAVAAEEGDTSSSEPMGQMKHGKGMMMHGGNMPMMAEMNKMMKNCNTMMERMMGNANSQDGDSDQS